jgi:hypothetical protein
LLSRLIIVNLLRQVKQFSFCCSQTLDYPTATLVRGKVLAATASDMVSHVIHLLTKGFL